MPINPCANSPCGPNSVCRDIGGVPSCSCIPGYEGSPPYCRPECTVNADCASNLACIRQKCQDPCPGSCGLNAECRVLNHIPNCNCLDGYTGDPFTSCRLKPIERKRSNITTSEWFIVMCILVPPIEKNPCNPSPCGPNALCSDGVCTCLPEYHGDPYRGCRPECVLNDDCPRDRACVNNRCIDPCPGTCGQNAECTVINHIPTCSCLSNYTGNAFVICSPIMRKSQSLATLCCCYHFCLPATLIVNPCNPTPCGPNSHCRSINEQAVCSCVAGYIGSPPTCRPECISSSECSLVKACINQKCLDPCIGTCGIRARCEVINHNPICSCPEQLTGDPFTRCIPYGMSFHIFPSLGR